MIISGLQTGNTSWLARHLQNVADNEHIELADITGTVAHDIDGALAEFDAYTAGTRAREGVYAAFINPPRPLSREQYFRALELIEQRLGLYGQPRIVLFHVKAGREHCHVVWSRIDLERMKAIHLAHDRQKLRRCAQQLSVEFGTELPPGLKEERGTERFDAPKRPSKAEKAMAEISGLAIEARRETITVCYRQADSAQAFVNALEAAGYMLAAGDRRSYVVVDIAGHVHSLARQIDGARTKDVKAKLAGIPLSQLPPVARAKAMMAQRAQAQQDAVRAKAKRLDAARAADERLKTSQKQRRAKLDLLWQKMKIRQMHEWKVLLAHIKTEEDTRLRRHWTQIGLAKYLKKIAVIRQLLEHYEKKRRRSLEEYHRQLKESLKRRHENEARELRRRYEALMRLEVREQASFFIAYGDFATSSAGMQLSARFAVVVYVDDPADHQVTVGCGSFANFEGWRDAAWAPPDDIAFDFGAEDDGSVSFTFNVHAAGWRASARSASETEEEQAGAQAHGPSFGGGMSM